MKGASSKIALKLPLFSRFQQCQESGDPLSSNKFLSKTELYDSILDNIVNILEARHGIKLSDEPPDLTVIEFGIADITHGSDKNFEANLQKHITHSVEAFEPRLQDVIIKIDRTILDAIEISIKACIVKEIYKDVTFLLKIKHSGLVTVSD